MNQRLTATASSLDPLRTGARLLVLLSALVTAGCEISAPPEEVSTTTHVVDEIIACGETAPACLAYCGGEENGAVASCVDGDWRCDTGVNPDICPDYNGPCGNEQGCGAGYTCVRSVSHPVPAVAGVCRKWTPARDLSLETCNDNGLTTSSQLWSNRLALTGQIVKVVGTLDYSVKCSKNPCSAGDPCCNSCKGNYVLQVADPTDATSGLDLSIHAETMACGGTTCEVTCGPYIVGDTHVMWGVLEDCISGETVLFF
jgi:hypothetical protein